MEAACGFLVEVAANDPDAHHDGIEKLAGIPRVLPMPGSPTSITSLPWPELASPFGDGTFIIGLDVASGTWRSQGGDSCYWERLSGFSGELKHVEANDIGGSNNIVTIQSTEGFSSANCGIWTRS